MPNPRDVGRGEHGRHAMLCVGYSDVDQVFIVRNSWGADWGVKGYCYMPYNYLMSKKLNDGDCWMLRSANRLPEPEETWIDDDKPVVKKSGAFKINEYPATAYDRVEIPLAPTKPLWNTWPSCPKRMSRSPKASSPQLTSLKTTRNL
ncbi:MAG: hypothetical protein IPO29_03580 [Anaerolineae bacterium]|nr:hypothetical protein [Anaerolineae bacterium]